MEEQLWIAGPAKVYSDKQAKQRDRNRRKVASGENEQRMERRRAARAGLSVECYREMRALVSIFGALRRANNRVLLLAKECEECGKEFETRYPYQRQCGSGDCRKSQNSRVASASIMRRYYADPDFRDKVNAQAQARRASKLGLGDLEITLGYLLERDCWVCGICHRKIRRREDASLDHIVPLSRGGSHELANVQASHKKCNYAKGNRGGGEQTRLIG